MITKTPLQIGEEIKTYFPYFRERDKFNKEFTTTADNQTFLEKNQGGSDVFNDFCQIGALLTDERVCIEHLTDLSREMEIELASRIAVRGLQGRPDPRTQSTPQQLAA